MINDFEARINRNNKTNSNDKINLQPSESDFLFYYKTTKVNSLLITYVQFECATPLNYLSMSCINLLVSALRYHPMLDTPQVI